ncbi:uncharacterized protein LOC132563364 [Ylistrum balloti]|uniref:uncharacterized protein LOC132563364 n=1 Tax=Ylistrum balloti TaxID=509963 RepID=UPI002905C20E|nr:uncharacterized protein LOC132563364 [Ylistrum balloti]
MSVKFQISFKISQAVAYLHSQTPSVINRDIKPENVLIADKFNVVKICDMGLSKLKPFLYTGGTHDRKSDLECFGRAFAEYSVSEYFHMQDREGIATLIRYMEIGAFGAGKSSDLTYGLHPIFKSVAKEPEVEQKPITPISDRIPNAESMTLAFKLSIQIDENWKDLFTYALLVHKHALKTV